MNPLAIDASLTATAVHSQGGGSLVRVKSRGLERLATIRDEVLTLAHGADAVFIEGYAYGARNQAHQIGELGGVLRLALWEMGLPVYEVPPSTLKMYGTGKGTAGKDAMIAAAIRRFGFEGSDNNAADACVLWHFAKHALGEPVVELPQSHTRAFNSWKAEPKA